MLRKIRHDMERGKTKKKIEIDNNLASAKRPDAIDEGERLYTADAEAAVEKFRHT